MEQESAIRLVEKARRVAHAAHEGQLDKSGNPYIGHPAYVAAHVSTPEQQCVAWLHDVVEDTATTLDDLREAGMPEPVVRAVGILTRRPEEDYFAYIERVGADPLARAVKLADLWHNMDLSRLPSVGPRDLERLAKYRRAVEMLAERERRPLRAEPSIAPTAHGRE